ncbi:MAG: sulfotransferase [Proteobacteria bacterium]|nr:sulfotransferase [Pseudomonadota bacterium]MCP4917399.1 sulfotransferase [Pseudomonadota bacterium]
MDNTWTRFDQRWGLTSNTIGSEPVFVLAAGWRSGSTLLQRLICSSGEILIWGEPYGRAGLIPAMTRSAMTLRDDWPHAGHFSDDLTRLQDKWIANLYPPAAAIKKGYEAQLDALIGEPARQAGFSRFGLKEVRLHGLDARFLNWIYPDARFVFLVRNPWDAWSSCKGSDWYLSWPDRKISSAAQYASHWRRVVESFLRWPGDDAILIRYEDLIHPEFDLEVLRGHCRVGSLDGSVLTRKLRGMKKLPEPLTMFEAQQIQSTAGELAQICGYEGPSAGAPGQSARI